MNPMSHRRTPLIVFCPAVLALSLASGACSEGAAPPRTPATAAGAAPCHITGAARVLARRVFVPAGVRASEQDGHFTVRFATGPSECISIDWPSDSDRAHPESCPSPGAQGAGPTWAQNPTLLAWESNDGEDPHFKPNVVAYDAPDVWLEQETQERQRVAERAFYPLGRISPVSKRSVDLAPIGHDRFLLAWVEGNVESHQLRAEPIGASGDPLGPSMVLSPSDASVIGRPSVWVAPSGDGLVTYTASIDGEFDVFASSVSCEES